LVWPVLWILGRWLLERMHLKPFQVHELEIKTENLKTHEKRRRF
jgi:hypothetical protein